MTPKKQDLIRVIASRANAIDYWSFMKYLPNTDTVMKKMGVFAVEKQPLKGLSGVSRPQAMKKRTRF